VFLVLCDYLAHIVAQQYGVLPIGVLTAIVGAPYFIYLLRRRKSEVGWS
jgi:iron complex transport system permease protein